MNLPIPTAADVVTDIEALLQILYAAFEGATQQAREFFDLLGEQPNPFLYPSLVRYFVKRHLDAQGHATEDEQAEYERDEIANNGLMVSYQGPSARRYAVRMLKADNGGLPPPGDSQTKQRFYSQQQLAFAFIKTNDPLAGVLNLVVLWEITVNYNFWELQLSCPSNGMNTRRVAHDHWTVSVPHPAEAATAGQAIEEGTDGADDVGFTLPHEDTGTDDAGKDGE